VTVDAGGGFDLELAASALQANAGDVQVLLTVLAEQLADVLGSRLEVTRAGGRLRRGGEITSVRLTVGNDVLEAVADHGSLRCTAGRVSGGIRIRTEPIGADEWVRRLLEAVRAEAAHSDAARQALERMVIGGTT
jgi:hypothetical protein